MKYNYFEALEKMALCTFNSVFTVCGDLNQSTKKDFLQIRNECDKTLFEIENALFEDFLPPLERDNIAAYAHCLSRTVDCAGEHMGSCLSSVGAARKQSEEEKICIELSQKVKESTNMLRKLKSPGKIPEIEKFRELLRKGLEAHNAEIAKISSGTLPKSYAQIIISCGRLRAELARCFDELLEIMLNNI